MASRLSLQTELETLLGNRHVYYQPPESSKMEYPAIVYSRKDISSTFAGNSVYQLSNYYDVTVIDEDPDSVIVQKVANLPSCRFDRHFTADNLNHDTFVLYY